MARDDALLVSARRSIAARTPRPVIRGIKSGVRAVYATPTSGLRVIPDFLIIGAQRAGTTSLYRYLTRHPAVAPAVLTKGAHYFDTAFDRGPAWYRGHFPTRWTADRIRRRAGAFATGEGSPYYLFHPLAGERIAAALPDAKLIALLRDPVERAYSQWKHETERGFETLPFEEALRAEPERLAGERDRILADPTYRSFSHQHHSYAARGMYADQLAEYLSRFPRAQVLVLSMEAFFADPDAGYRSVLGFIGLPERSLSVYEPVNARPGAPMPASARAALEERFREPNARLAELGYELGWCR